MALQPTPGESMQHLSQLAAEKYGPIGTDVIHVHHIVPVSQMGGSYQLNPIKDLIPLCPNCHTIVHRKTSVLEIETLKALTGFTDALN